MRRPRTKKASSLTAWINNQVWNTSLLWLLGCIVAGTIFYNDTSQTQRSHSAALSRLEAAIADNKKDESGARDKIREQFFTATSNLTMEVATLSRQTAVTSSVMQSVQRELEKIAQKLDNLPPARR